MNKQESDILNALLLEPFINQRILSEVSGHSLGVVNRSLKELIKADYLDDSVRPTMKALTEFKQKTPKRAIILAAGFGMRDGSHQYRNAQGPSGSQRGAFD